MKYRFLNTPFITPFFRAVSYIILETLGWTIVGRVPATAKKYIVTIAPHTSNWDFLIMLMTAFVLRLDARWIGKHTLFRFPFGSFMRYCGGIPVNRSIPIDLVAKTTTMFDNNETFIIGIAPEGTRGRAARWHTGFWYIAHSAGVSLYPAYIDYKSKRAGVAAEFRLTKNVDADMERLQSFYRAVIG